MRGGGALGVVHSFAAPDDVPELARRAPELVRGAEVGDGVGVAARAVAPHALLIELARGVDARMGGAQRRLRGAVSTASSPVPAARTRR